jgi:hypothetical protein
MAHSSISPAAHHNPASAPSDPPSPHQHRIRRRVRSIWQEAPLWVHITIVAAGALLAIAVVFISANWPYRHRKIRPMLEDVLTSDVTFSGYHRIYFPRPGFVASGITIRRKTAPPGAPPLGQIDSMMFVGTWTDLIMLRRRVELIDITGFHAIVPAIGSRENKLSFPQGSAKEFTGPDTMIEHLILHNSLLEIRREHDAPLLFPIKQVELDNFHHGEAMTWAVDMQNAIPHGHILAHGTMGPIKGSTFLTTPISGNFAFTDVNLHDVGEISGRLDTRGVFKGTLQAMRVETSGITQNFAVTDGKPTSVEASMQAVLHASDGNLEVHSIDLKVLKTQVHALGSINDPSSATNLDITVDAGRAEDLMRPFVHEEVPISGPVFLKAHAYLGPPGHGFMERLRLAGSLNVPEERLTNQKTEKSLSSFSERAAGKQKNTGLDSSPNSPAPGTDVLSSLEGPAKIENGVVSTPHITFRVPGAEATLAGTFRFHDQAVHLTGNLKMATDISHAAAGFKSFLLKPLAPFFKKKNAGAVVPIAVTGLPGDYKVSQDISHTK